MLTGARSSCLAARRHPAVPRALVAAYAVGAIGGVVPTGLLVEPAGAGLGRGAEWGLWMFVVLSPFLVVYAACAVTAARYEADVDRDLFLAGRPQLSALIPDMLAAAGLSLSLAAAAAFGGAVVGMADAAARGTGVLTSFAPGAAAAACAVAVWWTVLTALLVALLRNASVTYLALVLSLLLAMTVLQFVDTQTVWDAFSASPVGVFTVPAAEVVGERRGLVTKFPLVAAGGVFWLSALALLVFGGRRRLVPKLPQPRAAA